MAKENPPLKTPARSNLKKETGPSGSAKTFWFSRDNTRLYNRRNFTILSTILFLLMVSISFDFGVNGDEKFQVSYSKKLWNYYTTMGKDTAALNVPEGNMHLYGGLFDLSAMAISKLTGISEEYSVEFHAVRRFLCAVFGFIAILFTGLLGKQIGGWPLAFLSSILMFVSPRFLGDSMVNPKDIPFAAGFIVALYYMSKFIRQLPSPGVGSMAGVVIGVMIALNTRAGGLLLIVYLFLFTALYIFLKSRDNQPFSSKEILISILITLGVGVISFLAGIIFWPYALANPLVNPFKALTEFTNLPISLNLLFAGGHISSSALPWNYIPEWLIRTIPLFSIVGLFFFIRLLKNRAQDIPFLEVFMLIWAFLFPVVYAIYSHSALHDGWRHFLFIYPPLVLIASLGWYLWFTSFSSKYFRLFSVVLLLGLLIENVYAVFSMHPYQYAYFNPLFGGIKKAYGNFETDYWMLSVKEASEWLQKHEQVGKNNKPYTITTNCMYPTQVYMQDSSAKVKISYTNYYNRSTKKWDYAIFYSRFVNRNQLLNGAWPPKGSIHVVRSNGVALCAVVKRDNQDDYLGFEAWRKGDTRVAIKHFLAALQSDPGNETVSYALAEVYKNDCLYEKAEEAIQQSLTAYPDNPAALQLLENIKLEKSGN